VVSTYPEKILVRQSRIHGQHKISEAPNKMREKPENISDKSKNAKSIREKMIERKWLPL
jgi:hypothetical protein